MNKACVRKGSALVISSDNTFYCAFYKTILWFICRLF